MSALLVCPRSKGNTFNVCRYIADNCDADMLVIDESEVNELDKYRSIILCSSVRGDRVHARLVGWLGQLEATSLDENVRIHLFLTWFGRGQSDKNAARVVRSILEKKGLRLEDDYMTCYGGMGVVRRGHPNKEDCETVLNWVKVRA